MNTKNIGRIITLVLASIITVMILGITPNVFATETVQSKIDAIVDEGTVTLDADITEALTIPLGKTITINLNGHKITVTGASVDAISNYGTLTIEGTGEITAQGATIVNYPQGTVTVNNGNYLSTGWYTIKNMGIMIINNLSFKNNVNNGASLIDNGFVGSASSDRGVTNYSNPVTLTINGGTFENNNNSCNVIKNDDYGMLTINDGTFIAKSNSVTNANPVIQNWNKATIKGGTFTSTNGIAIANGSWQGLDSDVGELTIEGGAFTSNNTTYLFGLNGDASENKGFVKITGGTFNGLMGTDVRYTDNNGKTFYTFNITGGIFTSANVDEITSTGYIAYEVGDKYVVDKDSNAMVKYIAPMQVGKTEELQVTTTPAGLEKYTTFSIKSGSDVVKLEGTKLTALKTGSATISYKHGRLGGEVIVKVYEVKLDYSENESNNVVSEILAAVIENLDEAGTDLGLTEAEIGAIDEAKYAGDTITVEVVSEPLKEVNKEEAKLIEEKVEEGQKLAGYYDISVLVKANGDEIAKLRELGKKIKIQLELDSSLPKVADGFVRKFFVIKIHNGKAEIIAKDLEAIDGKIPVEANEFSTYAVAYTDVEKTEATNDSEIEVTNDLETEATNGLEVENTANTNNPKTGDAIAIIMVIFVISVIGMAIIIKLKRNLK